ncbi:MAG: hypothetical protein ACREDR_41305 [Blastocatellia bacterium]
MKSSLIEGGLTDQFYDDVGALASIPRSVFEEAVRFLAGTPTAYETPGILAPIATKVRIPPENLASAIAVSMTILRSKSERNDSIGDVLEDLVELGRVEPDAAADLRVKLELFEAEAFKSLHDQARARETIYGTFPVLSYFETKCSIAAGIAPPISRSKDKPETYAPGDTQLTPVVVVQLDVDRFGDIDRVSFALREKELLEIISHLEIAHKQLRHLAQQIRS